MGAGRDVSVNASHGSAVDLLWLPLGAGGRFVRLNGRVYEFFQAAAGHRARRDLYHTALEVRVPEGHYVIENAWPIPDGDAAARGVTVEGPVWSPALARSRVFRYEVRRWRDGTIADANEAVESPMRLSEDDDQAHEVLDLAGRVPVHVWGRDELHLGEMWNSNSVISWILTSAGIDANGIQPPPHGRAPGWSTGIVVARNAAIAHFSRT
jgi:hypothetical protein